MSLYLPGWTPTFSTESIMAPERKKTLPWPGEASYSLLSNINQNACASLFSTEGLYTSYTLRCLKITSNLPSRISIGMRRRNPRKVNNTPQLRYFRLLIICPILQKPPHIAGAKSLSSNMFGDATIPLRFSQKMCVRQWPLWRTI